MSPTLPYLTTGALLEQGGAPVAGAGAIPCSVWPATSSTNERGGRHHSHSGEADLAYVDLLRRPNRSLLVDGVTYKIEDATPMTLVPHVVLRLNHTSGRS